MSGRRLRVAQSDELEPNELAELTALCEAAFGKPFADAFARVGPGLHVIAEAEGRAVAHAMIVDRRLYLGHEADTAVDVGYVEHVAALPAVQRQGHATATIRRVGEILGDEYALGALATRDNSFYERLGWETWRGPTGVRLPDGERVRSASQDGEVMILRTPRTPAGLDVRAPIFVDWRADEPW